jgi:hypothetical protein
MKSLGLLADEALNRTARFVRLGTIVVRTDGDAPFHGRMGRKRRSGGRPMPTGFS